MSRSLAPMPVSVILADHCAFTATEHRDNQGPAILDGRAGTHNGSTAAQISTHGPTAGQAPSD